MPGGDETQVQEKELLENYAQFILNALEAILKENQTSLKYVRLLTKRIELMFIFKKSIPTICSM